MDEQEVVWDFIASLKTNKQMYMCVLTNESETLHSLTEPDLLEKTPIHKLLYWLQIMKYLLTESVSTSSVPDEVALYTEKKPDEKKGDDNSPDKKSPVKGEISTE